MSSAPAPLLESYRDSWTLPATSRPDWPKSKRINRGDQDWSRSFTNSKDCKVDQSGLGSTLWKKYHAAISEIVPKIQRVLLLCSATQHQHSLEQGALILRSTLLLEISPLIFRGHLRRFSHVKSTVCVWNWLEKLDYATNTQKNNNKLAVYV